MAYLAEGWPRKSWSGVRRRPSSLRWTAEPCRQKRNWIALDKKWRTCRKKCSKMRELSKQRLFSLPCFWRQQLFFAQNPFVCFAFWYLFTVQFLLIDCCPGKESPWKLGREYGLIVYIYTLYSLSGVSTECKYLAYVSVKSPCIWTNSDRREERERQPATKVSALGA